MMEFSVRFTKYKSGERIISGPTLVRASDFNSAVTYANFILQGMRRGTENNTDFEIASIEAKDLCGLVSEDMNDIWNVG